MIYCNCNINKQINKERIEERYGEDNLPTGWRLMCKEDRQSELITENSRIHMKSDSGEVIRKIE